MIDGLLWRSVTSVTWIIALGPRRNAVIAQRHIHTKLHKCNLNIVRMCKFVPLTQGNTRQNSYWLPILLVFVHKKNLCRERRCGTSLPLRFMRYALLYCCRTLPSFLINNCFTIKATQETVILEKRYINGFYLRLFMDNNLYPLNNVLGNK